MNRFYRFLLISTLVIGSAVFAAEAQKDEAIENYTTWHLPKAAKARFGKGGINAIQFSPDGTHIAIGSSIGIWIYDLKTGKEVDMLPGMSQAIAFSPDGRFIASGGGMLTPRGGGLQLWETATNQKSELIEGPFPAAVLHLSDDGKTLTGLNNWGNAIGRLDIETGQRDVKKIDDRSFEKMPMRHSPEPYALTDDKFAVGGQTGKIELWSTTTGQKLSTLSGHGGPLPAVEDGLAIQEDIRDQMFFPDEGVHVLILEFSPDGKRLASGSQDKTVRLWDTNTNEELAILQKHTGWINALAFSSDGKNSQVVAPTKQ